MNPHLILTEKKMNKIKEMGLEKDDFKDSNYNQKKRLGILTENDIEARKQSFLDNSSSEGNVAPHNMSESVQADLDRRDNALIAELKATAEEQGLEIDDSIIEGAKVRFFHSGKEGGKVIATNGKYQTILDYLKDQNKVPVQTATDMIEQRELSLNSIFEQMKVAATAGNQLLYRSLRNEYATLKGIR